jgi:beta-glucanase (GH16 family)
MRARRCLISTALFVFGCSSAGPGTGGNDAAAGSGGKPGSGGGSGAGGASGASGTSGAGGASGASGASGTAGASGAGGAAGHGGASGAGGASGMGAAGPGGTSGTAGAAGHGGISGAGGASGHGGAAGHGGASGHGGAAGAGPTDAGAGTDASSAALPGWVLTWSDEFNGADGSAVDPSKWVHDVGGDGWGNQEVEYYTDGTQNAVVTGGNLVITATTAGTSGLTCSYPSSGPCKYTSARLLTQGKFSQQYGRFEARIQIPEGQGLWPAFWMLGADINTMTWPTCGEVDIMENIGKEPSVNHGSLHLPAAGTTNDSELTGMYTLPNSAKLGDGFHTYAVEWSAAAIKFYVDDTLYETQTPSSATGRTWEFDHPFFILLNVAVGGQFPGAPDTTTTFPQTMKVDWVRVYQPSDAG